MISSVRLAGGLNPLGLAGDRVNVGKREEDIYNE